nr:hypothetical protein [Rothia dentocariosa]
MHLWKKNMVYSMIAGTATCVILINWVSRGIPCLKDLHTPTATLGRRRNKPATNRFSILSPPQVWRPAAFRWCRNASRLYAQAMMPLVLSSAALARADFVRQCALHPL